MSTIIILSILVLLIVFIGIAAERTDSKGFRIILIGFGILILLLILWMAVMVIFVGPEMKNL